MFYDRFIELCEKKGVKPGPACTAMGVSRSLAAKWKNTCVERPSTEVLEKMSAYFGLTIDEILNANHGRNESTSISDDDIKAAFFNGADDLSKEEMDAMWDDAKAFIQFKMEQRKRSKNE